MAEVESEGWESVNDNGFVYKRKKWHVDLSAAEPPPDPELEARRMRQRMRSALLKVIDKYAHEISLWEHMANALTAMEQSAADKQQVEGDVEETLAQAPIHPPNLLLDLDLDKLLLQVEGQEAIIHHITNLCQAAEAFCDAHEENVTQSLLDLPVRESPLELMASLSEHDGC